MDAPEVWWSPSLGEVLLPGLPNDPLSCSVYRDGWDTIGRPADAVQLVPAEPVDEKGRGPSYERGRADGPNEQRAAEGQLPEDVERISVWCRAIAQKARAQGNEALAATAPRIAEELDRALAGQPLQYARDPDPVGLEVVAYLRDRGLLPVDDGDQPPFAPELADAPLVTGESGAPAPLVVDHPVHESTLPAELAAAPHGMAAVEFDGGPLHELDLYVQLVDGRLPELLVTDEGDFWVTYVLTSPATADSTPRYRYAGSATDSERSRCPYIDANGPRPEEQDDEGSDA